MRNLVAATMMLLGGMASAEPGGSGHMQHCPTAVQGAKTTVHETDEGVVVTVTGKDEAEIRKRAKHLVEASQVQPTTEQHNGNGHGGGGLGRCVVVLKETTVQAEDVPGGSKITVKPTKPVDVDWLKKETKARQLAMNSGAKKKG
jgi:hypothetical protein